MIADWENNKVRNWIVLIAGTFLIAFAVNVIFDPAGMVTGGVTGLGIVVKYLSGKYLSFELPVWLTNLVCNIPLLLLSLKAFGWKFVSRTLIATGMLSFFIYILPQTNFFAEDLLLACVVGGVISGTGMGMVLSTMSTTGGTDVLCMLIHEKKKHYSVPQLMNLVDGVIVVMGIFVFGLNKALYAIIAVYIVAKVSDNILEGMKFAKMAYIISDKHQEIAEEILTIVDRGVTGIYARGMYSDMEKKMLFCVVSKKEMVVVLDIVNKKDPLAFVVVCDAREVKGEGFIEFKQENK
ncbi:MAG: YitT family protein [Lachnospiraceae bacterium]|nr:YitT family protein [Lachnospiraceae bacterium]